MENEATKLEELRRKFIVPADSLPTPKDLPAKKRDGRVPSRDGYYWLTWPADENRPDPATNLPHREPVMVIGGDVIIIGSSQSYNKYIGDRSFTFEPLAAPVVAEDRATPSSPLTAEQLAQEIWSRAIESNTNLESVIVERSRFLENTRKVVAELTAVATPKVVSECSRCHEKIAQESTGELWQHVSNGSIYCPNDDTGCGIATPIALPDAAVATVPSVPGQAYFAAHDQSCDYCHRKDLFVLPVFAGENPRAACFDCARARNVHVVVASKDSTEGWCRKCGRANVNWFAPNSLWNRSVRTYWQLEGVAEIICPVCFIQLAEEKAGIKPIGWQIVPEDWNANDSRACKCHNGKLCDVRCADNHHEDCTASPTPSSSSLARHCCCARRIYSPPSSQERRR